jgi:hypothetical protein
MKVRPHIGASLAARLRPGNYLGQCFEKHLLSMILTGPSSVGVIFERLTVNDDLSLYLHIISHLHN